MHGTVAILMDILSLDARGGLPVLLAPWSSKKITFLYWHAVIWVAWGLALAMVALKLWRLWSARKIRRTNAPEATEAPPPLRPPVG